MEEKRRFANAVGRVGPSVVLDVERGHVRRFAEATLDDDPLYFDDDVARAAGHPAVPAPPTFAISLRAPDPRAGMDIDYSKLLHAEQSLLLDRPIYIGDRISVQATIVETYEKVGKAGPMDFMVIETVGTDRDGKRVFRSRSLTVIRR